MCVCVCVCVAAAAMYATIWQRYNVCECMAAAAVLLGTNVLWACCSKVLAPDKCTGASDLSAGTSTLYSTEAGTLCSTEASTLCITDASTIDQVL